MFQTGEGLELRVLPWQHQGIHNYVSFLGYNVHAKYQLLYTCKHFWSYSLFYELSPSSVHSRCPKSYDLNMSGVKKYMITMYLGGDFKSAAFIF